MKMAITSYPKEIGHREVRRISVARFLIFPWFFKKRTRIFEVVLPVIFQWYRPNGQIATLVIKPGFQWDGASIPPSAWGIVGKPWDKRFRLPSVLHDALYVCRMLPKEEADDLFGIALRKSSVSVSDASLMELAVELGGGSAWRSQTKEEVELSQFVSLRIS